MKYTGIFDTHAHYDDERFDEDRDTVLGGLSGHGVSLVVDPACDLKSCEATLELSSRYSFVYSAVGVHPHSAESDGTEGYLDKVNSFAKNKKVVAIGEIGLDYHYDFSPREKQIEVFSQQLALANDLGLPVIIHDREAHADTLELVQKYRPKGIIHCYSGSAEMAREFLKLGMYIGFTGSVTFKNANKLLLAAMEVPEDRILLETDCPYMAPVPYRGQRCDSTHIPATAERLAELRGTDAQTLIDRARENGRRIYGIEAEDL
ncbi:MAG: TatD family hydrolase [Oscillospiraceae bacterium]